MLTYGNSPGEEKPRCQHGLHRKGWVLLQRGTHGHPRQNPVLALTLTTIKTQTALDQGEGIWKRAVKEKEGGGGARGELRHKVSKEGPVGALLAVEVTASGKPPSFVGQV